MAQIGIDFGTTNSLIVAYNKGRNEFFYFNFDLETNQPSPTSSTVWYHDKLVQVGAIARENINTYAGIEGHHFEKSIKLKLGQEFEIDIFGENVSPNKVAADILKHIKNVAELEEIQNPLGVDLNRAIFTLPINFNGIQRRALRQAANDAGIEIISFIHEPFAAIVGYFFTKEKGRTTQEVLIELESLESKNLLIFDWGGGTLDITVVKIEKGKMLELGTSELTGKAGDKFDEEIAFWAWNKFTEQYGSMYSEGYLEQKRKDNWDKILAMSEFCKISLSNQEESPFIVRNVIEDKHIRTLITRTDFENLINNAIIESCNEIDKAIKEARIGSNNIDQVLLTGGTCYIPAIQEKIKDKFGHKVKTVKNADLLIAQGAAVISEMGWLPFLTKDISIQLSDDSLYPIFEKNTNIAADTEARKSEDLVCTDNRGGDAKIIIVEGDGQRKDKTLSIIKVPVLNDSRFTDDIKLDAEIDKDIILKISARSLMVHGFRQREQEYSIRKQAEIHQLCFGLDFSGGN